MSYESERHYCLQLIYALECIVDILDRNPATYPLLMKDIVCLLEGRVIVDKTGNHYLINGLRTQINEMYETFEALDLEVQFEGGCDEVFYDGGIDRE